MKHSRISQYGFTLIEMLVAITVSLILILLIGRMFFDTSKAVQTGVALSDVITGSRGANTQFLDDFEHMLGPHDGAAGDLGGGFLVIAQHVIYPNDPLGIGVSGVQLAKPSGPDDLTEYRPARGYGSGQGRGEFVFRPIRSDQIVFIRERGDQYPVTPWADNAFSPIDDNGLAQYIKVWYGHVNRTNLDGSDYDVAASAVDNPARDGALGNAGGESRGSDWFLGRQALFLGESLASNPGGNLPNNHANGAWCNAPVVGSGASVTDALYMGLTDYAYASFEDPAHPNGCLVTNNDSTGTAANLRLYADLGELSIDGYKIRALRQYTYTRKRLRGNPSPPVADEFEAWQVAQMHPFFIEHVSDFIVEFAGDYETANAPGTMNPDGFVDTDPDGNIKWYSYWYNEPPSAAFPVGRRLTPDASVPGWNEYVFTEPATYPFPTTSAPAASPYRDLSAETNPPFADGAFVWRHDDEAAKWFDGNTVDGFSPADNDQHSFWPYLIRIRYRIHDKKGRLGSVGQHGVWFEQVFKVNRPLAP